MSEEIWRAVEGYEGIYEVSDAGRVRALARRVTTARGVVREYKPRLRQPQSDTKGYLFVGLCKEGVCIQYLIHRLVATAFLINPMNKSDVNHKDGCRYNNAVDNLEWVTHSENLLHAFTTGLATPRQKKLNKEDVIHIRALVRDGFRLSHVAYAFDISPGVVASIHRKTSWKHVE